MDTRNIWKKQVERVHGSERRRQSCRIIRNRMHYSVFLRVVKSVREGEGARGKLVIRGGGAVSCEGDTNCVRDHFIGSSDRIVKLCAAEVIDTLMRHINNAEREKKNTECED